MWYIQVKSSAYKWVSYSVVYIVWWNQRKTVGFLWGNLLWKQLHSLCNSGRLKPTGGWLIWLKTANWLKHPRESFLDYQINMTDTLGCWKLHVILIERFQYNNIFKLKLPRGISVSHSLLNPSLASDPNYTAIFSRCCWPFNFTYKYFVRVALTFHRVTHNIVNDN